MPVLDVVGLVLNFRAIYIRCALLLEEVYPHDPDHLQYLLIVRISYNVRQISDSIAQCTHQCDQLFRFFFSEQFSHNTFLAQYILCYSLCKVFIHICGISQKVGF